MFNPFSRIEIADDDRFYSGLGIGLAIARFIMHRHDGRLEANSEPGKGSVFRLYLPYTDQPQTGAEQPIVDRIASQKNARPAGVYTVAATS